jgi:death-on-curing protein
LEVHADQIKRYGGGAGIRAIGLLQSALAQPEASFAGQWLHPTLFDMAAAHAFHLCQNHPFIDGNKRTALACALVFLELNDISLLDSLEMLGDTLLAVASGKMTKAELAEVFQRLHK